MTDPHLRLRDLLRAYPDAPRIAEQARLDQGTRLPAWPDWCFAPMALYHAVVGHTYGGVTLDVVADVARLAAIIPWRYTLGIYRFADELRAALAITELVGDLPSEALHRLPQWSLYLETPGMAWGQSELAGAWVHLEWDANDGRSELRFLLNTDRGLIGIPVHLGPWPLAEAVARMQAAAERARPAWMPELTTPEVTTLLSEQLMPLLSLVLYLCSDAPEVDDAREPGRAPVRPQPVRTRRGERLFAASRPTIWLVGQAVGEALRALRQTSGSPDVARRTVRPHIRRGHWHGYWSGPRDGERRFRYLWQPPIVVAGTINGDAS